MLRHRLEPAGGRLLVAVSGGLDSMVLLDLLHRLAARHRWCPVVAHFNHQLRGAASDADQRFVRHAATRLRLPSACGCWPREDHGKTMQFGLEMAARLARHQFLGDTARAFEISTIALAHHADDQAELFFLRLLRGAGGDGLAGMKWRGPSPTDQRLMLIRPLLDLRKDELSAYAEERRIRFREDASNRDTRADRNWFRKTLLPSLARRFGASGVTTILRAMELTGADADFTRRAAEAWLASRRRTRFDLLHPAVQRHCMRLELKRLGLPMGFELVEHLRESPNQPVAAAPGAVIRRDASGNLARCEERPASFQRDELDMELSSRGRCVFGGVEFTWVREQNAGTFRPPKPCPGQESFDGAKVGLRIKLRHWRPGDRFQPIGMAAAVKLQDLFTNAKIAPARRRGLVVAESADGEIFWVEGLRIAERFKLGRRARLRLKWSWSRKEISPGEKLRALKP